MRPLLFSALIMLVLGCASSQAQVAATLGATTAPAPTSLPLPVSAAMPPPGAAGSALGTLHLNLANPIAGSSPGSIQICPSTGVGGQAVNFPVDATDATTNAAPNFGASEISGSCGASAPTFGPGVVSGSESGNGAIPVSDTEGDGLGLSPLAAVPAASAPNTSCGAATMETPAAPTPYDSSGAASAPSPSGC